MTNITRLLHDVNRLKSIAHKVNDLNAAEMYLCKIDPNNCDHDRKTSQKIASMWEKWNNQNPLYQEEY